MEPSPTLRSPTTTYFGRSFTVEWEVHFIHFVLQFYMDPVFSHVIDIECHAKSSWRLGLLSARTHLKFFLVRCTSLADELDRILVRYKVCLLDKFHEAFYEESRIGLNYTIPTNKVIGQYFADGSPLHSKVRINRAYLNNEDNVYGDVLRIRCELTLCVNVTETIARNFTPDLIALSNDIKHFRDDADFCDLVWHSTEVDYQLNTTLLQARVPNFHMLASSYDACSNKHTNIVSHDQIAQCRLLKCRKDPTAPPPRCFNEAVLAEVLCLVASRTRPYPFVLPSHTPNPRTLRECFTAPVCEALLSYLYSGQAYIDDPSDVRRLSQIARGLSLHDLVRQLEDCPPGCHTITEMVEVKKRYRISADYLKEWEPQNFPPYEKTLTLSNKGETHVRQLKVSLQFVKSGENSGVARIECRFTQPNLLPMLLIANIKILNEAGEEVSNSYSGHMYKVDTPWHPKMHLRMEDLSTSKMECLFAAIFPHSDKVKCSGFMRFKKEPRQVCVQSFRQLSGDLLQRLRDPLSYDVVLVAQGKTMAAHIFVLCARSRRFRDELRSKWGKDYKITHLVPGIDFKALVEMVKYMYSGDPDLENSDSVEKLRSAAESFGVTQLKDICQNFLDKKARR